MEQKKAKEEARRLKAELKKKQTQSGNKMKSANACTSKNSLL